MPNLAPLIRTGAMLGAGWHIAGNSVATGTNRNRGYCSGNSVSRSVVQAWRVGIPASLRTRAITSSTSSQIASKRERASSAAIQSSDFGRQARCFAIPVVASSAVIIYMTPERFTLLADHTLDKRGRLYGTALSSLRVLKQTAMPQASREAAGRTPF